MCALRYEEPVLHWNMNHRLDLCEMTWQGEVFGDTQKGHSDPQPRLQIPCYVRSGLQLGQTERFNVKIDKKRERERSIRVMLYTLMGIQPDRKGCSIFYKYFLSQKYVQKNEARATQLLKFFEGISLLKRLRF